MRRLALVFLVASACATGGLARVNTGEIQTWPLGRHRHHIEVLGLHPWEDTELRHDFHLKAVELCAAEGASSYAGVPQFIDHSRSFGGGVVVEGDVECLVVPERSPPAIHIEAAR